jgi:hypothetical protein
MQNLNDPPPTPTVRGTTLLTGGRQEPLDPVWAIEPPRLRIQVRLDLVTTHDVERLAGEFRHALRSSLERAGRHDEHALRWLRTVKSALFNRDLRRYDLHREEGLSFRQIAYLERTERVGKPVKPGALRGMTISIAPGAESSVRGSVQRVYQSIYRVPYRAKRMAASTSNVLPYKCATHPSGDCPLDCPVLIEWCARVFPSLPKQDSGS